MKSIPQFELPQAEVAFNLASETTFDGEKLAQERAKRTQEKVEAARIEQKQQQELFMLV